MFPYFILAAILFFIIKHVINHYVYEKTVSNEQHGPFNGLILRNANDYDSKYKNLNPEKYLKTLLLTLSGSNLCDSDDKDRICASIRFNELVESGELTEKDIEKNTDQIISLLNQIKELLNIQPRSSESVSWRFTDTYFCIRYDALSLLRLLAKIPLSQSQPLLYDFLHYDDPELACEAVTSLFAHGVEISIEILSKIASNAEVRNILIERVIKPSGRINELPKEFITSEAVAESKLVRWLIFPTELNCCPDVIELEANVVVKDGSQEEHDFFVFKFQTYAPHWAAENGWMLGISGPYPHNGEPDENSGDITFSQFDKIGTITPVDLVTNIIKLATEQVNPDKELLL